MSNVLNENTLLFSKITGDNFYLIDGVLEKGTKIVAHHFIESNVFVEIKVVHINNNDLDLWKQFIFNPPDIKLFEWPCDIVDLRNTIFNKNGNIGIVFLKKDQAQKSLTPVKDIAYNDRLYNVKNECAIDMKSFLINFLSALTKLEKDGYLFISFDLEKMFYNKNDYSIYFYFSTSTLAVDAFTDDNCKITFLSNDLAIDFINPWCNYKNFVNIRKANAGFAYYSVAAFVFKLLTGRMPYQGRLFDGNGTIMSFNFDDGDEQKHIETVMDYLSNPVFIFDKTNSQNSIGIDTDEERCIERYEALNDELKFMFESTFKPRGEAKWFSFEKWLNAIKQNFKICEENR